MQLSDIELKGNPQLTSSSRPHLQISGPGASGDQPKRLHSIRPVLRTGFSGGA